MRLRLAAALLSATLLLGGSPARAEWLKASSRHFVIYSDTSAERVGRIAMRLERLDAAMRLLVGAKDTPEAAANPVTVYVLDDTAAIRRLIRQSDVAGFYLGRADGAVAFAPRVGIGGGPTALDPQIVLFHEYGHHFLLGSYGLALPAWFSEGFAEFVSTATADDKQVVLGRPANHRAWSLRGGGSIPLPALFAPPPRLTPEQREGIYSRGWVLTHYLFTNGERNKLFRTYITKFNTGTPPLQAATEAFGDLADLDRRLRAYANSNTLNAYFISSAALPVPAVSVRPLTGGERALIEARIVSTRGVDRAAAIPLYRKAAAAAAAHPGDAVAQAWLAEMAYDAGEDAAAEAAADRALAVDPKLVQALVYKGRVRLRRAEAAKSANPAVWREARSWIVRANRVEPNAAGPLEHFYDSFRMEGAKPSASAVAGVHRALELAPQDRGLRFKSAAQRLTDGQVAEAKRALRPLAYDPHAGPDNPAVRLLALLDSGRTGPAALEAMAGSADGKGTD